MAVGVQKAWSVTDDDNATADTNIGMAEGQSAASLNDGVRAVMAAVKGFANQLLGAKTSGGSANAYTYTSDAVAALSSAYAAGMGLVFKANHSNSGASTLNVDSIGATAIRKGGAETALASGDIVEDGVYFVVYNGTYWLLLNPETGASASGFQPLDATLTALAALSWSSLTPLVQFTAADTVALTSAPKVTTLELGDAADTTLSRSAAGVAAVEGDPIVTRAADETLSGDKTFSGKVAIASDAPQLLLNDTDAAENAKKWGIENISGLLRVVTYTDNDTEAFAPFSINRDAYTPVLATFDVPVRARTAASSETSGTLTVSSANRVVQAGGNITLDGNVFTAGDMVAIYAGASARTLTQGSTGSPTQRLHGSSTTGNLTLAARGMALVYFISATEWVVMGDVS